MAIENVNDFLDSPFYNSCNKTAAVIAAWNMATKLVEEKFTSTNTDMAKCTCVLQGENRIGAIFIVRKDCPIHKGTLRHV